MGVNKIEHIGIAVKSLADTSNLYEKLLGVAPYKMEAVETEHVKTLFFNVGESKVELLEASSEESAITKFIAKRGEGIHHIAFHVDNIEEEMSRLRQEGFRLVSDQVRRGADNKWVCFVYPKDTQGVLIELCQDIIDE
ncbi:MAG: methylmalonyl-CoA epimerase [Sphingobacteriaceae bacterium]|jgi:methylmalonyl-CoA/ethylmalonyl-CoA epimerase|nr:MAG: methylmalonyl-CoA epimerase [Pedobacter sp.]